MSMTRAVARQGLRLTQARVCLDCDCLTVEQSCPWCDREGTVPLSAWFRPMEPSRANATRHAEPDPAPSHRWVLIVQHHQRDLYRVLRQALTGTDVEVVYERRVGQRRRAALGPAGDERRGTDRRRPKASAAVYRESTAGSTCEVPLRQEVGREPVEVDRPRRRQTARV
jgi:hypothetical protein